MSDRAINLNADLGESFGAWTMGHDAQLMPHIQSANVACGFHAGDPVVMRQTVQLARAHGVSIGAHPSFPDLQGFGRRRMAMSPSEVEALVLVQIGALQAVAKAEGHVVSHVKPHGALSNMACADEALADAVARATQAVDPALILLAPALSALARAGRRLGLTVVDEIFADRRLAPDGQLLPRSDPRALIHDPQEAAAHVLAMLEAGALITVDGTQLPCRPGSVCVHGDQPRAVDAAAILNGALSAGGWHLKPLSFLA